MGLMDSVKPQNIIEGLLNSLGVYKSVCVFIPWR